MPSLVGMFWSALFFILVSTFQNVPQKPSKDIKFFSRLKIRFHRLVYTIMGLAFLILTVAVVMLSLKLSGIWRSEF